MKILILFILILTGTAAWLWDSRPVGPSSISGEDLKSALNDEGDSNHSLGTALQKITGAAKAPSLAAATALRPAPSTAPDADRQIASVLRGAQDYWGEIARSEDADRKIAEIKLRFAQLDSSQSPLRLELTGILMNLPQPSREVGPLLLQELHSSNEGIKDTPRLWQALYADQVIKAYFHHAPTSEDRQALHQAVESENDPAFKQLLKERLAASEAAPPAKPQ